MTRTAFTLVLSSLILIAVLVYLFIRWDTGPHLPEDAVFAGIIGGAGKLGFVWGERTLRS